jgi:hypothetical protein
MNSIVFPLRVRMQGPQVGDLQDALQVCLNHNGLLANDETTRRELSAVQTRACRANVRRCHNQAGQALCSASVYLREEGTNHDTHIPKCSRLA